MGRLRVLILLTNRSQLLLDLVCGNEKSFLALLPHLVEALVLLATERILLLSATKHAVAALIAKGAGTLVLLVEAGLIAAAKHRVSLRGLLLAKHSTWLLLTEAAVGRCGSRVLREAEAGVVLLRLACLTEATIHAHASTLIEAGLTAAKLVARVALGLLTEKARARSWLRRAAEAGLSTSVCLLIAETSKA